ncbi:MAG: PLDc N-terminal domain-containing protein [Verrucomicrobiales bacterium]|nr:PLDc N-terminal domain-containing protein [Verrucomicrobiales bacterium]
MVVSLAAAAAALTHVILFKRDPRSAAYWVALVLFVPLAGSIFYLLFGINFIRRQGRILKNAEPLTPTTPRDLHAAPDACPLPLDLDPQTRQTDCALATTLSRISRFEFANGNSVTPLRDGEAALPRMVEAIRKAQKSVTLASYIFEANGIGADFVSALADAAARGVEVRVMVDDAGTRYSRPPITRLLRQRGVVIRRYMPNHFLVRLLTLNLRNHRKLLVVDGHHGFTGGMNIREGNMLSRQPDHPVQDLHFEIFGPVVRQLQQAFAEDWEFCSGEVLSGPAFYPDLTAAGKVSAIGIPDGPDADMEVMPIALFAALAAAQHSIKILTPYFLPNPTLIWALNLCAIRGVDVRIVTPAQNNIPIVNWAARTLYPELLHRGCRIYESPGPFDHSKLFLVDDAWSFVGSTNWDPRSLRLNFEFNLACLDPDLTQQLAEIFETKRAVSTEVTLEWLRGFSLPARMRHGLARLFIPLL